MNKRMLVKTNDSENKEFYITILGKVEKVADISPRVIALDGRPGEKLTGQILITPAPKYPFSILKMEQSFSKGFVCKLIAPKKNETSWKVAIEAFSDKPDSLYEIIRLKTDSPHKPELKIRVYAMYSEKPSEN